MKVLDLFCGMGGWSIPFLEDGDDVWGIDIKNYGYPGHFISSDIRELDGYGFSDMDLIIGSPPCTEFSGPKHAWPKNHPPKPEEGVKLIEEFHRFVREAQPRFWAMENIQNSEKWYKVKPQWRFKISHSGRRFLWTNIRIPLSPEFRFDRVFGCTKETRLRYGRKSVRASHLRAKIPYSIARFIADIVKTEAGKTL